MKAHVVLVVLCVLAASMLALAAGAADQQLRAGGESVVGIEYGDERSTPSGTDTPAGTTTPTPSSTSDRVGGDGSADDSTDASNEEPGSGEATDAESTPTPEGSTGDRGESTPSATATTESGTAEATPGDHTDTDTGGESDTVTETEHDERAGFALPGLGAGLGLVGALAAILALVTVAAYRR